MTIINVNAAIYISGERPWTWLGDRRYGCSHAGTDSPARPKNSVMLPLSGTRGNLTFLSTYGRSLHGGAFTISYRCVAHFGTTKMSTPTDRSSSGTTRHQNPTQNPPRLPS